jgi:hypothetical protein
MEFLALKIKIVIMLFVILNVELINVLMFYVILFIQATYNKIVMVYFALKIQIVIITIVI